MHYTPESILNNISLSDIQPYFLDIFIAICFRLLLTSRNHISTFIFSQDESASFDWLLDRDVRGSSPFSLRGESARRGDVNESLLFVLDRASSALIGSFDSPCDIASLKCPILIWLLRNCETLDDVPVRSLSFAVCTEFASMSDVNRSKFDGSMISPARNRNIERKQLAL